MFEKIGRLAEKAATNVDVSRRGFLGRLGKGALAVAGALGLAASKAEGTDSSKFLCCYYRDSTGYVYSVCLANRTHCYPQGIYGGAYVRNSKKHVSSCTQC